MEAINEISELIYALFLVGIVVIMIYLLFAALPLAVVNIISVFRTPKTEKENKLYSVVGMISFLSSIFFTYVFMLYFVTNTDSFEMWYNDLSNGIHSPVSLPYYDTFVTMLLIGIGGYLLLSVSDMEKIPPLLFALSIAMIYAGAGLSVMWIIQTADNNILQSVLVSVFPINFISASTGLIRRKLEEYSRSERIRHLKEKHRSCLSESLKLPLYGLLLLLPLLGVTVSVLMLFGQDYDSLVRMWTQTSDWNLSQMGEPTKHIVNIIEDRIPSDGHYLCTVAAGGHKKLVRPQRRGKRRGHSIIVNRQLCIANAFEQLLEERTPGLHKAVRGFYDKYGFPVAKLIRRPVTADIVYIIMKPLEWIFLFALYISDSEPEKRIALQYLPEKDKESLSEFLAYGKGRTFDE